MAFKIVADNGNGAKFKFENPGDSLTGYYLGSSVIDISGKPVTKHEFQTDKGDFAPLGSADLDRRLSNVPEGMMTRVTYLEKKSLKGGKTLKVFKVEVDEANTLKQAPKSIKVGEKSIA